MNYLCFRWLTIVLIVVFIAGPSSSHAADENSIKFATQTGHQALITSVAASPDGQLAMTGSQDLTVKLWDLSSGKEIHTFTHPQKVTATSFSHDGRYVLALGHDTIRVWDVYTKEDMGNYTCRMGPIGSASFHPQEKNLILFDCGLSKELTKIVGVYDISKKQVIKSIQTRIRNVSSISLNPDGSLMAIAGYSYDKDKVQKGLMEIINYKTGTQQRLFEDPSKWIFNANFSPDGTRLVTTTDQEKMVLWDTQSWNDTCSWPHKVPSRHIAFSSDGKYLAAEARGYIRLFDTRSCQETLSFTGTGSGFNSVSFLPGNQLLLTSGRVQPQLWDAETGREVSVFYKRKTVYPLSKLLTVDEGRYVIYASDMDIAVWDIARLKPYRIYKKIAQPSTPLLIGPDKRTLIFWQSAKGSNKIAFMDYQTGVINKLIEGMPGRIYVMAISPDGKMIAAGGGGLREGWLYVWDIDSGQVTRKFDVPALQLQSISFSPDNRTIVSTNLKGQIHLWDIETGRNIWNRIGQGRSGQRVFFDSDGKNIFYTGSEYISILNASAGETLKRFIGHRELIESADLSADGKSLITGDSWGNIKCWDISTGKESCSLAGRQMGIKDLLFQPGARYALSCSGITMTLWNLTTGDALNMVTLGDEWLVYTEDGLFDASYNGVSLVAMVRSGLGYGIDQLALKNNRPDIIMQRFGLGTPELISHYQAKYRQRLKKAGYSEADLSSSVDLPDASIKGIQGPDVKGQCRIDLEFRDVHSLKSYQVYINDVPLFGAEGRRISGKQATLTEIFDLTPGQNKIEVSVMNAGGQESLRPMKLVNYKAETVGDLYFLGFGVSRYREPGLNLEFAHKDALDLAKTFGMLKTFKQVHIRTYTDEQVTVKTIKDAKGFLQTANPNDTFILFIAGHGLHDHDAYATYYFLTHDADLKDLASTAASFELIEDLLMSITPRKKLFLMDTCESGEADEQGGDRRVVQAGQRGLKARTSRAIIITGKEAGNTVPRKDLLQKDRFIYTDLMRRSGTIVFSSSRGGEFSYESSAEQNGFFTKEIIRALTTKIADTDKDGFVSTDELRAYVSQAVGERTNNLQNPTVDRDNIHQKFGFRVIAAPVILEE